VDVDPFYSFTVDRENTQSVFNIKEAQFIGRISSPTEVYDQHGVMIYYNPTAGTYAMPDKIEEKRIELFTPQANMISERINTK
jgi:hypothetical protein